MHPHPATGNEPAASAPPVRGLRERKKERTRAHLQHVALQLFREHGYDETTVEEVCRAADVSMSTFFRYFPTKQDLVLYDAIDPLLIDAYRAQPATLSPLRAFGAAMTETVSRLSQDQAEEQRQRALIVWGVPALRDAWLGELIRTVDLVANLLAERVGREPDDPQVRIHAGALLGALLAAMRDVSAASDPDMLLQDFERALVEMEQGLPLLTAGPAVRRGTGRRRPDAAR